MWQKNSNLLKIVKYNYKMLYISLMITTKQKKTAEDIKLNFFYRKEPTLSIRENY